MHIQISTYLQLLMTALGSYDSSTPLEGGRCKLAIFLGILQKNMQSTRKVRAISTRSFRQLRVLPTLGPSLEHYLIHSYADIAAISDNGDTYVYHYSGPTPPKHRELDITAPAPNKGITIQDKDNWTGAQGIHELKISDRIPSSSKLESP